MKTFVDSRLIHKKTICDFERVLLEKCVRDGVLIDDKQIQIAFGWSSLLKYLEMESVFEKFPDFNEKNDLFAFMISAIELDEEKDLIIRLYDQVFVESLTHVKAIEQIHPNFILGQIRKKRELDLFSSESRSILSSLDAYEKLLVENPYETIHDLTLYLAWDRVCVNLTRIFECVFSDQKQRKSLQIIRECLIESFHHITEQGRTKPSFFRLMEALFAYEMREENLQLHTDSEWLILCQGLGALRSRGDLAEVSYMDGLLNGGLELNRVFTLDSSLEVKACLALGQYMNEKLTKEVLGWLYEFSPVEIVCLNGANDGLVIEEIVFR